MIKYTAATEPIEAEVFDRTLIYEKLDKQPQPEGYSSKIPWVIQQQIANTNGIHYADSLGLLDDFPIPPIPIPKATGENQLCMDIGCGWGRWCVAIGRKNYIPVGVDLRLEFAQTARETMRLNNINGYAVVGDLKHLPFKTGVLDGIWSYSVIQHTHKERFLKCLENIHRIIKTGGFTFLEFPNKTGIRNAAGPARKLAAAAHQYNSWVVRYYSIPEYRAFFAPYFKKMSVSVHSMIGIGVLPNDLQYAKGFKNRLGIAVSLATTQVAKVIKPLKYLADSIYIFAKKTEQTTQLQAEEAENADSCRYFLREHQQNPQNNLNIIHLLRCPLSGGKLHLTATKELICYESGLAYKIVDNVPIMIPAEARVLARD